MSHFTALVTNTDKVGLDAQMEPFNEGLDMPMHIYKTRQAIIDQEKENFEYTKKNYEEYLKDPKAYKANCSNKAHIKYIENEVPEMLNWTDEQWHEKGIKYYDNREDENGNLIIKEQEESAYIDKDGNMWSQWNENAKWDWYQVGGRWAGFFKIKDGAFGERGENGLMGANRSAEGADVVKVGDIDWEHEDNKDLYTYAVLHEGVWYEKGEMGWWGMSSNEDEEWPTKFKELIESLDKETEVTVVDCHI